MARIWKYAACLLIAFVLGIGNVWGANLTSSVFIQTYAEKTGSSAPDNTALTADFPSYMSYSLSSAANVAGNVSTITTPHDFSGMSSTEKLYHLKMGSSNTITLTSVSNIKYITLYGAASNANRIIRATFKTTVGDVAANSFVNGETWAQDYNTSNTTTVKAHKIDISSVTGYSASAEYTIELKSTSGGDYHIYGIYIEAGSGSGGGDTPSTYTVTYDGNGNTSGDEPTDSNSPYTSGSSVTVLGKGTLVKENCVFAGWNTAANGSGTWYDPNASFSMGSSNVTLYAQWALNLTTHTPGVFEKTVGEGGYGASLITYEDEGEGKEYQYETYFFSYSNSKVYLGLGGSYVTSSSTPLLPGFNGVSNGNLTSTDNWLNINANGFSGVNTEPVEEFAVSSSSNSTHYAQIREGKTFTIKVQGYDQFSFGGRENGSGEGKQFVVKINGATQTISHSTSDWNMWRFALNPATTYTIEVSGNGASDNRFRAFSLRLPAPSCPAPKSLTNGTTTYNSQAVTWTKGDDESAWEVIHLAKDATAPAANATPDATVTSASYTFTGLTESTAYDWYVRAKCGDSDKSDWVKGTSFTTEDIPACAAGDPGDITKGTASGGTGAITLTAAGSAKSGDTWYWQSAADGVLQTDEYDAENGKVVSLAGTYYLRSYNASGTCWSDAKNVTVAAADLLTAISPTLSYATSNIVVGNTSSPTLEGNTGSGSVSYALNDVSPAGSLTINSETGVVTAVTAGGTATVTATIAANGNYAGNTATSGTITAVANPLGTHTLTWAINVSTSSETDVDGGTTDIGTGDKDPSSSYISNMTDLTGVGVKRTTTGKNGNTGKIETPASYDEEKYVSFTFDIASGYQFTPSAVSIKTVAVSTEKDLKFEFSDANGSYSVTKTNLSKDATAVTNELDFSECNVDFTGTVTVKIYVYGAENMYRLSTPLTITGTIAAEVTKYDLTFAAGTGASGSMATLKYAASTEVTLPACTFTAPTDKEFDAWVVTKTVGGAAVTVTNGKFTMPTEAVTATATWKDRPKHTDATLSDLTVGGTTVTGFASGTTSYNVELPFGTTSAPTVAGTANDEKAKSVVVTQAASANGDATVVVTAEDNSTKTYTIHFSVVATKDLLLVFKTGSTACVGTPSTATQILSNNAAVSTYINQITFTNVEGSGDNGKEGGSLDVGKKAGNMFTLSAKAGFAMKSMNFLAKIEDANCEYSLNGGEWTTLTSTDKKNDVCYEVFADAEVHEFRLRSTGNSGVWIRNMQLTMIQACTPKTIAWTTAPASEYEVGKSGYAIAASANNGTVTYAASNAAITVNESTGALTINSLTNDIDLSASVPAGDGTLYCATPASVVKEEIKTYYLVTFDAQNETAVTEVKYYSGDAAIALPSPSYSGYVFQGWFDAAEEGNQITEAITPSASRTVYAQWIAQCDGPTITTQPASAEYKTGRAAAALACTATAGAAGELTYSWYSCDDAERTNPVLLAGAPTPSTAVAGTFYYYCTVQEAECDVVRTSNVAVITVTEKDPVCIIKATPTSGAEATADGAYKGNAYFKGRSTDKKLNSDYDYVGVKLASGYTFLATDKVVLNQTANLSSGDISKFYIFTEVPADGKTYVTVDNPSPVKGDNGFEMPAGLVGESALYIGRVDANCNPTVGYLAVYRVMNPELVSLSVNSVAAAKGVGNAYSVTLPAGTNLASLSLTERIAWNAPAESDSKQVTTNEGAWAWGDNTYVLTDKDGDATAYTITLIEAAAIDHVAISGTLTVMEDASTTLSAIVYDTNDEPASIQDVTWSVKSGDEALAEVSALGVVTGKAVGTAHIIATSVADPTVSAQVEVTVTAFSGCKKAYWFGYAADAATNNVENNSTVFGNAPSNASNNSGKTIKLIEDEWEVSVSKKTGSIGNFGTFTVPAGYNATLYLVTNTGGSREFQLKQNDVVKYTQNASSGDPVITKFEDVAPGTYSVLSTSNCSGFYMMAAELCRVPMTGIALDITSKSMLTIDPVFQLTPTFTPATATDKRISWTTTDEDVVTVADGIVTPVGEGTATITVTTEDGGYTATCEVTVSEINCTSFDGTIYEMAAKEQATRKDIAVSGGEENEVALTVEDVVYTRGAAASLGVKGSSAKTPRITAKSEEALSSIDYNSADVYVKIPLGCNLRPTDVITFTANDDTKELKLGNTAASVGTISTSSLSYTVESGDALEGRNVLYVWRGDNTGFVSVNVTRVPLVTIESVALADLTIRAGKTNKPQLTVNPDNGTILSAVWEITAATGVTGSTIDAATGDVTAGTLDDPEQEGTITVKVTINEDADLSATCTVTVVGNIAQTDVDGSIIWDWHNTGATSNNQLTNKTDPKKNENFVLANVVPGNANFATDKLVVEGEHLTRDYDKATPYFQGQLVSFRFAEATEGVVRITYSHTAGEMTEEKPAREIYINDVAIGEIADNATFKASELIPVNASEVTITARNINSTAADDKQYLRIAKIEFYALDKVRDDSWIAPRELGTVCYPNGHIVIGADMYKMAGVNENGKFAFDQVDVTEPGVPYLFEATGYEPIKFYKTTAATAEEAGTSNGMVGTFVQKTLSYLTDENTYYFQGAHFYAVTDRSKDLVVPANRCYVDLNEPHPAAAPKAGVRRIVFGVNGTNTATGVENIQGDAVQSAKVLIDGKMYILRGEKMYDATGRLVK